MELAYAQRRPAQQLEVNKTPWNSERCSLLRHGTLLTQLHAPSSNMPTHEVTVFCTGPLPKVPGSATGSWAPSCLHPPRFLFPQILLISLIFRVSIWLGASLWRTYLNSEASQTGCMDHAYKASQMQTLVKAMIIWQLFYGYDHMTTFLSLSDFY